MRHVDVALRSDEELLTGEWVSSANGIVPDETCKRIDHLTKGVLEHVEMTQRVGSHCSETLPMDGSGSFTNRKARCTVEVHRAFVI
jgi:hypothetical protein